MSIEGMLRHRGAKAKHLRPTSTKQPNGSQKLAWTEIAPEVPVIIRPVTSEIAQMLWGQETKATFSCMVLRSTNIKRRDGLIVTSGALTDCHFGVADLSDHDTHNGSEHVEVGLELTPEAFV